MTTYIALLRGINVGGRNKILMADLKKMVETLGFAHVQTYIQSGNIVFSAESATAHVISSAIHRQFGFDVPVILRSVEEFRVLTASNPFCAENLPLESLHCTFLADVPPRNVTEKLHSMDFAPDRWTYLEREIFLHCPSGYGNTKLNNTLIEKKLQTTASTRNWKTVMELLRMAEQNT